MVYKNDPGSVSLYGSFRHHYPYESDFSFCPSSYSPSGKALSGTAASCLWHGNRLFVWISHGAHTAAELYRTQKISKEEASFLLAFCNNIGPVYFLSFALPTIGSRRRLLPFGIMYLLPLIYGLVLRYSRYRKLPSYSDSGQENSPSASPACFLLSLEAAIDQSLQNITKLGGYMILFNLLFILPQLAVFHIPMPVSRQNTLFACLCCLLEITGGISLCGSKLPLFVLTILPFGGLSCIAQTGSMLGGTDLSLTEYVKHKLILTAFTFFFYVLAAFLSWLP